MSNWFENHPTRSIVIYTLVIGGSVWAAFTFIFDENKVAVYRAEIENERATANQYKAKTEVLEVEIARLREENKKYLDWMTQTPKTIPYLEQRIKQLSEENRRQKTGHLIAGGVEGSDTEALSPPPYSIEKLLNIGETLIDPKTNATFAIGEIKPDLTANAVLGLPGEKYKELAHVKAGSSWSFVKGGKKYQVIISKLNWFSNTAEITLKEIVEDKPKPNPEPKGMLHDKDKAEKLP